jgi:hypothetical protein
MITENAFELSIPTHISCSLYENDEIDNILISVLKDCKNHAFEKTENTYTVKVDSLLKVFKKNKDIKEILTTIDNTISTAEFKPNSVYFLINILGKLKNLKLITFIKKNDINYSKVIKTDIRTVSFFNFSIIEGIFDLTKIFDRKNLDNFNRNLIAMNILPSKYMDRIPYFYMKTDVLLQIIQTMIDSGSLVNLNLLDYIDVKLEKDDPLLLVKTDYSIY